MTVKDIAGIFRALVVPFVAIWSFFVMGLLWLAGEPIPEMLWVVFVVMLAELGIEFGIKRIRIR